MDLDRFTTAELEQLHHHAYRWGIRLFIRSDQLLAECAAMPVHGTPAYRQTWAASLAAAAAGSEQHELLREVAAEMARRREAVHA